MPQKPSPSQTTDPFQAESLSKSYPVGERSVAVLKEVRFRVASGESLALMGPSGSGKSTLLSILGCLEIPSSGRLRVLGQDTAALSDDELSALRARGIGFVFQAFHLLPAYDALSNVLLGSVYAERPDAPRRARELLAMVGLAARADHRPDMLSGGERQRVAIARALINDPPILLADEPTGSLDQATGREVLSLLEGLNRRGRTLVVVTHDPQVARRMDRVIELLDGSVRRERTGRSIPA